MTVRTARSNGIEIAYETFGEAGGRPLLLVMGLATQMVAWHDDFCGLLVEAGFTVTRFDNRDVGLSTHLDEAPDIDVVTRILTEDFSDPPYTLDDLADDAAGLLDALGLPDAHVVGASMGGMVAQALAVRHPHRVRSLTSIMSTPSRTAGRPTDAALAVLLAPPATTRDQYVQRGIDTYRVIGSPGFPLDEDWVRYVAGTSWDRRYDPRGVARQLLAIEASGDRTEALGRLTVPTLVVHGADDQLIQVDGGHATAAAVPGAELLVIPGMGHNLPRELWPTFVEAITRVADRGEAARAASPQADASAKT